jgi:urease
MSIGKTMLGRRHVLPSVVSSLTELQIEGTFPSGTYLVTVHHPISSDDGDLEKALYGSFLPVPSKEAFTLVAPAEYEAEKMPGAVVPVKEGKIVLNPGRKRISLKVTSKGDRPIQVRITIPMFESPPDMIRSDRTITLLKRILNSNSTALRLMAIDLILLLGLRFVSSQVTPKRFNW